MSLEKLLEATTLGSVFGAPGDPNGGIFIGKLSGISGRKMRKRLLYPTYKNSSGKNKLVKNSLNESETINEEFLYDESGKALSEADLQEMFAEALDKQTAFSGGKFVKIEPKCMAFPYCNQGAIDKPVKLINGTKGGMCEGCHDYCNHLAEQTGKTPEWIAEGFRQNTLKKLEEITINDKNKIDQLMKAIEPAVEPTLFQKIKDTVIANIIDPFTTYEEILRKIKSIIPTITNLGESVEKTNNNKQTQNITEMIKVKNLSVQHRKAIMENMMKSAVSECMQKTLQAEGFLPLNEELNGLTMEESLSAIMEDDSVANEMFESVVGTSCECKPAIQEWLKENDFLDAEEETEEPAETPAETPDETGDTASDEAGEETDATDTTDEPSVDPAWTEPTPDETGDATSDGGDELQSLIDSLLQLQTKYAGNEEDSEKLSQVNDMLNQAKSLKDQQIADLSVEEPADAEIPADVAASADSFDGDDDAAALGVAVDTIVKGAHDNGDEASIGDEVAAVVDAQELAENVFDGTTLDSSAPAPVKKGAGGATRKPMDQDFIDKINKFKDTYLDELKWNSLKTYSRLSPEVNPEDIHTYLTPNGEENGIGFISRITDLQNDPTGINRMLWNMMNPTKRGYMEKFETKYDPEVVEGIEELMNDMWTKYNSIQAMLSGTHSPIEKDGEEDEGGEEGNDSWVKDDFADDFEANSDDAIAAKASANMGVQPDVPAAEPVAHDDDEELHEGAESKPAMGDGVLSDNKTNAKETIEQAKDAEATQDTEDQKVDELKNQKFEKSEAQNTIANKMLGMNNALDLDYDQEPSQEFKDRVLAQASGTAPADHANVDHDSTVGQQLIDAAKARSAENEKQFTSIPDNTIVKDDEKYEVTTAVNEDVERMKKLMKWDVTKLKENKLRSKVDEDKVLMERVQTKKFL